MQVSLFLLSIHLSYFCKTNGFLVKVPGTVPPMVARIVEPISQGRASIVTKKNMPLSLFSAFSTDRNEDVDEQNDNRKKIDKMSFSLFNAFSADHNEDGDQRNDKKLKINKKNKVPKVFRIESSEDYINFLTEDDRLCVIKFYASWCKSCQKFGVKFRSLAMEEGDLFDKENKLVHAGRVRFAEIEFSANAKLCRALKIKRLPNVHLYKGTVGQLSAFPCGPSKFPILESKIESFLSKSDEELEIEKKFEDIDDLDNEIISQLNKEIENPKKNSVDLRNKE